MLHGAVLYAKDLSDGHPVLASAHSEWVIAHIPADIASTMGIKAPLEVARAIPT